VETLIKVFSCFFMWMQADVMGDMEGFGVEQLAKSINGTGGQCCLALGVFFSGKN